MLAPDPLRPDPDVTDVGATNVPSRRGVTPLRILLALGRFVRDWLPVFVVLFAYDAIHNRIGLVQPVHSQPQLRLEQALFGSPVPTIRMQAALYAPERPHWWDLVTLAVYMSHFFVAAAIAFALWFRARALYFKFMAWFVVMTTLGYLTYVLFPAVPPWLASQRGELAATHRIVRELWDYLGRHDIASTFSGGNVLANDVAAIPSLHAAYPGDDRRGLLETEQHAGARRPRPVRRVHGRRARLRRRALRGGHRDRLALRRRDGMGDVALVAAG